MGRYLIPAAEQYITQAINWTLHRGAWEEDQVWDSTPEGIVFTDPSLTDAECAAVYTGFVPDLLWVRPLPPVVRDAGRTIRRLAYATDVQLAALATVELRVGLRALARGLIYLNDRLDVDDSV